MKTLHVRISESDFNQLGLQSDDLSFSELIDLVRKQLARQNLQQTIALAEKYGLSNIQMDEISEEVKAVRQRAKGHS